MNDSPEHDAVTPFPDEDIPFEESSLMEQYRARRGVVTQSEAVRAVVAKIPRAASEAEFERQTARLQKIEEQQRLEAIKEAKRKLAKDLGRRYTEDRCNLDNYRIYDDRQRETFAKVKALVKDLPALIKAGRGIILFGSVGSGKDHLLAALLYAAADHDTSFLTGGPAGCRWVNGQTFFGQMRDRMDSGDSEVVAFRELVKPAVLALSDPLPPVGSLTPWNLTQLGWLVDERYRELRSTWLAFNALNPADAEAKLSSPLWDRLHENAVVLPCFWPSFRERAK